MSTGIDELEGDLRAALAARADELPSGAGARVRAHDYRPRTRSVRPPIAAGAAAAAAAGATVWLLALSADTPPAIAGWSATPTHGAPGQVNGAEASCRRQLAEHLGPPPVAKLRGGPPPVDVGRLQPVLTDTRGPFTWVIFAGANASASCISAPSFTALSESGSNAPQTARAGHIVLASSSVTQTPSGDGYSFTEGRTGAGVTAVTLVLDHGTDVQTTVRNGWFVTWWPGGRTAASARVRTSAGTIVQQLRSPAPGASCPPAAAGARRGAGCVSGSQHVAQGRGGSASRAGLTAAPDS